MWPDRMCSRSATVVDDHAAGGVDEQRARLHLANCSAPKKPGVARAGRRRAARPRRPRRAARRGCPSGGRCRARAGRRCRRRSPAGRAPRRDWRAGCRCCRSRRCRACGRGSRGCPWRTCPRRRRASAAVFSASRRASTMISPITSSTTLRVLEYGALKTATPRSAAAARSTWLVPMQKQPIASRSGAASSTRGVIVVLDRIPSRSTPAQRVRRARPRTASRRELDLEAARLEASRRRRDGCSRAAGPSRSTSLGGIAACTDSATRRGRPYPADPSLCARVDPSLLDADGADPRCSRRLLSDATGRRSGRQQATGRRSGVVNTRRVALRASTARVGFQDRPGRPLRRR